MLFGIKRRVTSCHTTGKTFDEKKNENSHFERANRRYESCFASKEFCCSRVSDFIFFCEIVIQHSLLWHLCVHESHHRRLSTNGFSFFVLWLFLSKCESMTDDFVTIWMRLNWKDWLVYYCWKYAGHIVLLPHWSRNGLGVGHVARTTGMEMEDEMVIWGSECSNRKLWNSIITDSRLLPKQSAKKKEIFDSAHNVTSRDLRRNRRKPFPRGSKGLGTSSLHTLLFELSGCVRAYVRPIDEFT